MRVLLVTTWGEACGIAEHSRYLIDAVKTADPAIEIVPEPRALDPDWFEGHGWDVLHLNYHAALHSRWTPSKIMRERHDHKVLVTYHDTGVPNSDQCKGVIAAAHAAVVHEPFDDLPAEKTHYWRMGVPAAAAQPFYFGARADWIDLAPDLYFKAYRHQPVLGTIGFPFGWKNQIETARVAASVGWGFCCICPKAGPEYVKELREANPDSYIRTDFVSAEEAIQILSACDATAFLYVTHNTGQSGAILQGIAARKPVIALHTCRQFRSLLFIHDAPDFLGPQVMWNDETRSHVIRWCETFDDVALTLSRLPIGRVDAPTVAMAHRESWTNVGKKYAALYRSLVQA